MSNLEVKNIIGGIIIRIKKLSITKAWYVLNHIE